MRVETNQQTNENVYVFNFADTTSKRKNTNPKKSEVYAFKPEDLKKVIDYILDHEKWIQYLFVVMNCNIARRAGDLLELQWYHLIDEKGKIRDCALPFAEQKTGKMANPHLNKVVKEAIKFYLKKENIDPSENDYCEYVFKKVSGQYSGTVIKRDSIRKYLKRAAEAVGIDYNVGTHSTRKTFGSMSVQLHASDPSKMETLQTIYNHSDSKITNRYIGLTKQKMDQYFDDFGDFFQDHILGDKEYEGKPNGLATIDTNDLYELIREAYQKGMENQDSDFASHSKAIMDLTNKAAQLLK